MRATALAFAALFGLAVASTASAEVRLTIQNGHVSLVAKDATLRQILAEWARVGQTKIVNGDRVPGGPLTLQFTNVPEESALATLLRPLSGYIAAPRPSLASNLSRYDRIVVMPSIAPPPQGTGAVAPPPFQQFQPGMPQFGQPGQPTMVIPGVNDDQEDVPNAARPPVFNAFPQPQLTAPPQSMPSATPGMIAPQGPLVLPQPNPPVSMQPSANYPGAPPNPYGGVAVPGMIAAPQPGQPNAQPPKRPGGPGGSR